MKNWIGEERVCEPEGDLASKLVTNWIGEEWACEAEGALASKLVGVTGDKLDRRGVGM